MMPVRIEFSDKHKLMKKLISCIKNGNIEQIWQVFQMYGISKEEFKNSDYSIFDENQIDLLLSYMTIYYNDSLPHMDEIILQFGTIILKHYILSDNKNNGESDLTRNGFRLKELLNKIIQHETKEKKILESLFGNEDFNDFIKLLDNKAEYIIILHSCLLDCLINGKLEAIEIIYHELVRIYDLDLNNKSDCSINEYLNIKKMEFLYSLRQPGKLNLIKWLKTKKIKYDNLTSQEIQNTANSCIQQDAFDELFEIVGEERLLHQCENIQNIVNTAYSTTKYNRFIDYFIKHRTNIPKYPSGLLYEREKHVLLIVDCLKKWNDSEKNLINEDFYANEKKVIELFLVVDPDSLQGPFLSITDKTNMIIELIDIINLKKYYLSINQEIMQFIYNEIIKFCNLSDEVCKERIIFRIVNINYELFKKLYPYLEINLNDIRYQYILNIATYKTQ